MNSVGGQGALCGIVLTRKNGSPCREPVLVCLFVRQKSHMDRPGIELESYRPEHWSMHTYRVVLQELHASCVMFSCFFMSAVFESLRMHL
jgi:hypothetical protein